MTTQSSVSTNHPCTTSLIPQILQPRWSLGCWDTRGKDKHQPKCYQTQAVGTWQTGLLSEKVYLGGNLPIVCCNSSLHSQNHHQLNYCYWNIFPTTQNPLCSKRLQQNHCCYPSLTEILPFVQWNLTSWCSTDSPCHILVTSMSRLQSEVITRVQT